MLKGAWHSMTDARDALAEMYNHAFNEAMVSGGQQAVAAESGVQLPETRDPNYNMEQAQRLADDTLNFLVMAPGGLGAASHGIAGGKALIPQRVVTPEGKTVYVKSAAPPPNVLGMERLKAVLKNIVGAPEGLPRPQTVMPEAPIAPMIGAHVAAQQPGVPNAIYTESDKLLQSLRPQPGEGQGEVPVQESVQATGEGGQPAAKETAGTLPQLLALRAKLRSYNDRLDETDHPGEKKLFRKKIDEIESQLEKLVQPAAQTIPLDLIPQAISKIGLQAWNEGADAWLRYQGIDVTDRANDVQAAQALNHYAKEIISGRFKPKAKPVPVAEKPAAPAAEPELPVQEKAPEPQPEPPQRQIPTPERDLTPAEEAEVTAAWNKAEYAEKGRLAGGRLDIIRMGPDMFGPEEFKMVHKNMLKWRDIPEEAAPLIQRVEKELDVPVDITPEPSEGEPFAREKKLKRPFMSANKATGRVEIHPEAFRDWFADLPADRRAGAVRSRLWEERFHLATDDAAARTYWNTLTPFEQGIEKYAYSGHWDPKKQAYYGVDPTYWGQEAIRRRMQQMADMESSEIAEAAFRERWTLKGLSVLETTVRGIREALGTTASQEGKAILGKVLDNIEVAKLAVVGGAGSIGARKRKQQVRLEREPGESDESFEMRLRIAAGKAPPGKAPLGVKQEQMATGEAKTPVVPPVVPGMEPVRVPTMKDLADEVRTVEEVDPNTGQPVTRKAIIPGEVTRMVMSAHPRFDQLKEWADHYLTGRVSHTALQDMWNDAVDQHLSNISGQRLTELDSALSPRVKFKQRTTRPYVDQMTPEERRQIFGKEKPMPKKEDRTRREQEYKISKHLQIPIAEVERLMAKAQRETGAPTLTYEEIREGLQQQAARAKAIARVRDKLLRQALPDDFILERKDVKMEDIDWKTGGEKAWREILPRERNPQDLFTIVKDNARRSSEDPIGLTRRLLLLENRNTKEAVLVSAYPHGRTGVRLMEPAGGTGIKGRPNVGIEDVLKSYKGWEPKVSILLKDPIKDFRKRFKNRAEFDDYLGREASQTQTAAMARYEFAGEGKQAKKIAGEEPPQEFYSQTHGEQEYAPPEGTRAADVEEQLGNLEERRKSGVGVAREAELAGLLEAEPPPRVGKIRGEYGSVTGPAVSKKGELSLSSEIKLATSQHRGEGLSRTPITAREAMAVMDFATDEYLTGVGQKIDHPHDMKAVLDRLKERAQNKELTAKQWLAISGIRKLANEIVRKQAVQLKNMFEKAIKDGDKLMAKVIKQIPEISPDEAYAEALDTFYEHIKGSKSRADYLQRTMGEFEVAKEPGGAEPAQAPSRELTMRQRVPPTVVRRSFREPGPPITERRMPPGRPEGTPGPFEPPRMLSPAERQAIEATAFEMYDPETGKRKEPYRPTTEPVVRAEPFAYGTKEAPGKGVVQYGKLPMEQTYEGRYLRELRPQEITPGARQRRKTALEDEFGMLRQKISTWGSRHATREDIYRTADGAERNAEAMALHQANDIRLDSMKEARIVKGEPERFKGGPLPKKMTSAGRNLVAREKEALQYRGAAKAVIAAQFKPKYPEGHERAGEVKQFYQDNPLAHEINVGDFDKFIRQAELGVYRAEQLGKSLDPRDRWVARRWKKAAQDLEKEARFARDHYKDPQMKATVDAYRKQMNDHLGFMNDNGIQVKERKNYVPGRYDGEMFRDDTLSFGSLSILGKNYREAKTFDNYYQAIASDKGPYIPISLDIADLAQSAITQGRKQVNRVEWFNTLKGMKEAGQPVAVNATPTFEDAVHEVEVTNSQGQLEKKQVAGKNVTWHVPKGYPEYEILKLNDRTQPLAVRKSFLQAVKVASMDPALALDMPIIGDITLRPFIQLGSILKHGVLLIVDTFHPGRLLAQYGPSLSGTGKGFMGRIHADVQPPRVMGGSALDLG
jgi:hypothetical protein